MLEKAGDVWAVGCLCKNRPLGHEGCDDFVFKPMCVCARVSGVEIGVHAR